MAKRRPTPNSRAYFTHTAKQAHPANYRPTPMRGGYRM